MENQLNQNSLLNFGFNEILALVPMFDTPMPDLHVNHFKGEFQNISINGKKIKDEFHIDFSTFLSALLVSEHKYVNFCLIQKAYDDYELSFMIHFSDEKYPCDSNKDAVYLLNEVNKINLLIKDTAKTYNDKRNEFDVELGKLISDATNTGGIPNYKNTQIISYERTVVYAYFIKLLMDLSAIKNLKGIKFLKFIMIRFFESSSADLAYYKTHKGKISFAVCTVYEDNAKSIKQTASYDFGQLHP